MPEHAAPGGKIPAADIRDTAKQYQEDGVDYTAAMQRAVQEHLDGARREESRILGVVRQKYVEAGGKLRPDAVGKPDAGISGKNESPAFKRWFRDSKVVDGVGNPLVVYHGTNSDVTEMRSRGEQHPDLPWTRGIYFTADPKYASTYADGAGANVMPVYLSMQHPKIVTERGFKTASISKTQLDELRAAGHDGIINKADDEYIVFDPAQVKSATGNSGAFDPSNPSILKSRTTNDLGNKADLLEHMNSIADERGMLKADQLLDWVREANAPGAAPLANWLDAMGDATVAKSSVVKFVEHSGSAMFSRFEAPQHKPLADATNAAPRPLTERESVASMRDVGALNEALQRAGMEPVRALKEIPSHDHALAAEVAKAFGVDVRFVSANADFEGVAHKGVTYLSEQIKHPVLAIAGHEVYHALEQTDPETANHLLEHIQQYLRDGAVSDRQQFEQSRSTAPISERYALGEVAADLHGAMWLDHRFWKELAARDESVFRRTAFKLMQVLTRAVGALRSTRFDAHALVTDIGKVRSIIAESWAQHLAGRDVAHSSVDSAPALSRNLPDVTLGGELGMLSKHPDYAAAKGGDIDAAIRVAQDVVKPDLVERVRAIAADHNPIIQPVAAIEQSGKNRIPSVAAARLGAELGLHVGDEIVQSSSPKRTQLAGVDRIFARPEFDGQVEAGRKYILVDDTLTQGGTFAALARHIEAGGGEVIGAIALTGKQYSAKMALSDPTLEKLREKHGDIEPQFRAAAGHGFDALTESEGRYLANFKPADVLRDQIISRGQQAGDRQGDGSLHQEDGRVESDQQGSADRTPSRSPDDPTFSRADERDADADKTALSKFISVPKAALQSVLFHTRMMVTPMNAGSDVAMSMAKDFANHNRRAAAQWQAFDKVLRTRYTEDQLKKMWTAADQENDLRRDDKTSTTEGLASLDAGERKTVELLHAYGEQLWAKAKDAGLVSGDGVAFWTPRVAARIVEDGSAESIRQPASEFSKDARNLRTSASSAKQRQHQTTAESEAALKAKVGDDAEYVKNIRVMPMAMAQLERAIAGRTLVNQIKAHGKLAGEELVSDESGPNFVTFDHPALNQWRPKMDWQAADNALIAKRGYEVRADGVYRDGEKLASYRIQGGQVEKLGPLVDGNGKPVMESYPLYVRKDFSGPLKAVFSKEPGAVYRAMMDLKGGVTSMIMVSPLTHNLVIWGKAMPTMISTMGWKNNFKNAGTLGLHGYFVGNAARADHALMNELIGAGLVPVSGRGMNQDVTAIANGIDPGRSLTAKSLGAAFDMVSPTAGDVARKAVDKAGEVWHEKLLWDRVADLQAGMAVMMRTSLMDKGLDQHTANLMASHFANRYAGMIPSEAMSDAANKLLNLSLFSKSFTVTNLGAYKDLIGGLPHDVQAQIKVRAFELNRALGRDEQAATDSADTALSQAQSVARRKAAAVLILDIAAMTTIGSLTQALWQGQSGQQIADDFKERLGKLGVHLKEDPLSIVGHPLDALSSLSQTSDNPHGREDRVRVGEDEKGNSYYARLPVGKVGEELKQYGNLSTGLRLAHNKMSTFLRPIADLTANEDFSGKRIINPHDNILKQAAAFAAYWVKSQLPIEDLAALSHVARGRADTMDKLKLLGTATGLSVGRLSGGDAVAEMRDQVREHDAALRDVLPDVREAMRHDDVGQAQQLLEDAGQSPREIQRTIQRIDQPDHVSKQQLRRFNQLATDEERGRLEKMRSR